MMSEMQDPNSQPDEIIQPKKDLVEVILDDIGGTFKRYQIINYILFCLPFALSGSFGVNYVFTALNIEHRCLIPECDSADGTQFAPAWLKDAVPFSDEKPSNCFRYESLADANYSMADTCSHTFDRSKQLRCNEYVYKTEEVSILNGLHLECDDSDWKLAAVGTANNLGRFFIMPIMGLLSDRFGRRTILIVGVFGSAVFGYVRSFVSNYYVYVLFEFLDAGIGSVTYSASFILALEWVGVRDRILLGTLITTTYPFGQVFLGFVARAVKNYRYMLRIIYGPGYLILLYFWIAPESIRWLIVNRKKDRLFSTLKTAEKINGMKLSTETVDRINVELSPIQKRKADDGNLSTGSKLQQLKQVLSKRLFLMRFLILSFSWLTNAFVTYGISLTSVSLAGDKYVNFVVIAMAGFPAMLFVYFLMESLGRRWTIAISLMIGGVCIIASKILPAHFSVMSITFFFIGKCFITVSFTGLYVYTGELWPTNIRHTMMGFCSTIGRVGAALAPMAPLLGKVFEILPFLTFGVMALIAAILTLYLPETLRLKLPDTISEAERIGRPSDEETS